MVGQKKRAQAIGGRKKRRPAHILLPVLAVLLAAMAAGDIARAEGSVASVWSVGGFHPVILTCLVALFLGMTGLVAVMFRRALGNQRHADSLVD